MTRQPIVFLDCETLGLDPAAPIWEFACLRRDYDEDGSYFTRTVEFFIQHDPAKWLDDPDYPDSFKQDYRDRFIREDAMPETVAASIIAAAVTDAVVHASNPMFDMERIAVLLGRSRMAPRWHYHPVDVPTLVQGFLAARGELPEPPWKSDRLSEALGVIPADYARHTALGDVAWTVAMYDTVMDGAY